MSKYLNKAFNNLVNNFLTASPKDVKGTNNTSYAYYSTELYQMVKSVFRLKNAPSNWNEDYFFDTLFRVGYLCVVDTRLGVLPLEGSYSGLDVYNFPTRIIVANHVLGHLGRKIAVDGELLYFQYYFNSFPGIEPLIKRYAVLLASCDGSINTNLINSRLAHIFMCDDKAQTETAKYVYDQVSQGNPAVFINNNKLGDPFTNVIFGNVKNVYIGNELLMTKRTIYSEFLTKIGIDNANIDKRERLNSDEVNSKKGETLCLVESWKDTMNRCLDRCKVTFKENGFPQDIEIAFNENVIRQLRSDYIESN